MSARGLPLFPKAIFICGFVIYSASCLTILIYVFVPDWRTARFYPTAAISADSSRSER